MQTNGVDGLGDGGNGQPGNGTTGGPRGAAVPVGEENGTGRLSVKIKTASTPSSTTTSALDGPVRLSNLANNGPAPMASNSGANAIAGPSMPIAPSSTSNGTADTATRKDARPTFNYPRPTPEQLEDELPPLRHDQDVPLGLLLDRVVGKGYKDMKVLVEQTLPPLQPRERPLPVIRYAKSTRQTVLKYLAILRWKLAVDTVQCTSDQSSSSSSNVHARANGNIKHAAEVASPEDAMTPAQGMNGDVIGNGKGKGRAADDTEVAEGRSSAVQGVNGANGGEGARRVKRGRLLDIRRLEEFMKHQNAQHGMAVTHIQHVCAGIESLRIRNPDLLTSLALLSHGTYPRLPTSLTDPFAVKPPLTNGDIITTLHKLDGLIKYRLRCVDHVPAEMRVLEVKDGRVAIAGGARKRRRIARAADGVAARTKQASGQIGDRNGEDDTAAVAGAVLEDRPGKGRSAEQSQAQWRAEVTWVNFDDYAHAPRWWLTGVEWWWRERPSLLSASPLTSTTRVAESPGDSARDAADRSMDIDEDNYDAHPSRTAPPAFPVSPVLGKAEAQAQHSTGARKRLKGLERQRVLDYANQVILAPRSVEDAAPPGPEQSHVGQGSKSVIGRAIGDDVSMSGTPASTPGIQRQDGGDGGVKEKEGAKGIEMVDAPLVRLHNFIQHLSLMYQLEVLYGQAIRLAQGAWRGSLAVDMNEEKGELTLRYWTRARANPIVPPTRRPPPPSNHKTPLIGGTLTIAVTDEPSHSDDVDTYGVDGADGLDIIRGLGQDGVIPTDEVLKQRLKVKWEVGDGGEGGGWKVGTVLGEGEEAEGLELDPLAPSIEGILTFATRRHAAHLTRASCMPILSLPRINIFPTRLPVLVPATEVEHGPLMPSHSLSGGISSADSVVLRIPLPVRPGINARRTRTSHRQPANNAGPVDDERDAPAMLVRVSDKTGLIEIIDTGASSNTLTPASGMTDSAIPGMAPGKAHGSGAVRNIEDRARRTSMACQSVNDGRTRLGDDLGRLVTAVILEHVENQLRQLGYTFLRKLAMRSQDMTSNDLHPATCIFMPLPTIAPNPAFINSGMGMPNRSTNSSTVLPSHTTHYLLIRTTVHGLVFELLRMARVQQEGGVGWRLVVGDKLPVDLDMIRAKRRSSGSRPRGERQSRFEVEDADLRDLYIYCNAMVAQGILEQQLKDRSIPYTIQLPPASGPGAPQSRAAVAGMVPSLVMNVADLLKDPRAAEVAQSKVYMQLKGWWKGGNCTADTIVRLLHPPSAARPATSTKAGQEGANGPNGPEEAKTGETNPTVKTPKTPATPNPIATTKTSRAAREEGITFDQASSVVTFHADDLARCVPLFLEQWERLSKVIIIAGEVSKLARSSSFRDLRMLSFDLRSAIFTYAPQHYCSITYDPAMDAYISSFSRTAHFGASPNDAQSSLTGQSPAVNGGYGHTPNGQSLLAQTPMSTVQALTPLTPAVSGPNGAQHAGAAQGLTPAATTPGTFTAASPDEGAPVNPHEAMAGLLSWRLNELVKQRQDVAARFIKLLCATLPLLSTIEDLQTQHIASLIPDTPKPGESPSVRLQAAQNKAQNRNTTISSVQLVIRSIEKYKLVWDVDGEKRYAVDAKYLPGRNDAVIFSDAAAAVLPFGPAAAAAGGATNGPGGEGLMWEDESCGVITPINGWKDGLVRRVWQGLKEESLAGTASIDSSLEGQPAAAMPVMTNTVPAPRPASSESKSKSAQSRSAATLPPMCLDNDASLLVPVDMLESAIRRIAPEVETALSTAASPGSNVKDGAGTGERQAAADAGEAGGSAGAGGNGLAK